MKWIYLLMIMLVVPSVIALDIDSDDIVEERHGDNYDYFKFWHDEIRIYELDNDYQAISIMNLLEGVVEGTQQTFFYDSQGYDMWNYDKYIVTYNEGMRTAYKDDRGKYLPQLREEFPEEDNDMGGFNSFSDELEDLGYEEEMSLGDDTINRGVDNFYNPESDISLIIN
ncbi:hypothetical protein KY334_00660, partial [Candidatus Woesearchaeota archaeon]|nr:hypothetical protein [Candidatus Woesearchaeota archaeon]